MAICPKIVAVLPWIGTCRPTVGKTGDRRQELDMRVTGCFHLGSMAPVVLFAVGCTDANLIRFIDPDSPYLRLGLEAEVCAPPSVLEPVPHKVLFVVDTSGSTSESDPTPPNGYSRREHAVRLAISDAAQQENLFFGIITFSSEPRRQTFGFTRDLEILNGAADNIGNSQGGTNYSDTMWTVIDFIGDDLVQLSPQEAQRTHYIVYWLSDGVPTVGVTEASAIVPGVSYLRDLLRPQVAEFRLNTLFIGGAEDDPASIARARLLLAGMAAEGEGLFVDVEAGGQIEFDIDPMPELRHFELLSAVAHNTRAYLGLAHPVPDSDGDFVEDEDEERLGLDEVNDDTDGDGLRDGIELLVPGADPLVASDACAGGILDSDDDGLRDCEEIALGTNPLDPDTDGDLIPDSVEVALGGFPLSRDDYLDVDLDGIDNLTELTTHLAPRRPTTQETVERWAYRYFIALDEGPNDMGAPPCYRLSVANIGIFETAATGPLGAQGDTIIDLFVAFVPAGGGERIRFKRARAAAKFLLPDYREPASGWIELVDEDFTLLPEN